MKTTHQKIDDLRAKFGEFGLSQSVGLQTNYRTTVIEELTDEELDRLYNALLPSQNNNLKDQVTQLQTEKVLREKRSIALSIATRIGLKEADDWKTFNQWMLKSSIHKKQLNSHDITELDGLIRQLRAAEDNYIRSAQKVGNKAWYHSNKFPQPSKS